MIEPAWVMLEILTRSAPPMSEEDARTAIARVPVDVLAYAVRRKETCVSLAKDLKEARA